jgi:hypothetical protein
MTDDKLKEAIDAAVQQACDKLYEKLNDKLERLLADINGRLPKHPVVTVMPGEETVEAPSAMKVPFAYVPSGCVLNNSAFEYKFPIRVDSGGEVNGVTLTDGQFMTISSGGTCIDCTISRKARFIAHNGAHIEGLEITEGAFVPVNGGAYIGDVTIADKAAVGVFNGGSAWYVHVSSGGCLKVGKGAILDNVTVYSDGKLELNSPDIKAENIEVCAGGSVRYFDEACKQKIESSGAINLGLGARESTLFQEEDNGDDNV